MLTTRHFFVFSLFEKLKIYSWRSSLGGYKPTAFRPVVKHYSIDHLQMESELIQEKNFPPSKEGKWNIQHP